MALKLAKNWRFGGIDINVSGFPASGKIIETRKMKKTFSRPGKIMEYNYGSADCMQLVFVNKTMWKILTDG